MRNMQVQWKRPGFLCSGTVAVVLMLAVLLAACGGATSAPTTPTTSKPTVTTVVASPTATPVPAPLSVYFGAADSTIYALKASDGTVRWHYKTGGKAAVRGLANGIVYADSSDSYLYALNANDGSLLWKRQTGAVFYTQPIVTGDTLYLLSASQQPGTVSALDPASGAVKWTKSGTPGQEIYTGGGMLYVLNDTQQPGDGATDGVVYTLDAQTGALLWKYEPGTILGVAVSGNVVYLDLRDGMADLNAMTGKILWKKSFGFYLGIPIVTFLALYDADLTQVYALNPQTGAVIWQRKNAAEVSGLQLANGLLYINSDTDVYALNPADGSVRWDHHIDNPQQGTLFGLSLVSDGEVYVRDTTPNLFALDATSGAVRWQYPGHSGSVFASLTRVSNVLYAAEVPNLSQAQYITALNTNTGNPLWSYQLHSAIQGNVIVG